MNFFTYRDFSKSGGGSIRILGILNAVSRHYPTKVALRDDHAPGLDASVATLNLPHSFPKNRRLFYLLLSFLPAWILRMSYAAFYRDMQQFMHEHNWQESHILFFEYFDNAVAYFLKSTGIIRHYYCDIHGIVPLENEPEPHDGRLNRILKRVKAYTAKKLDRRVFGEASGIIFPSEGVKGYMTRLYPVLKTKDNVVVDEACNELLFEQAEDKKVKAKLDKLINKQSGEYILFFAGDFKPYSGVLDLIQATAILLDKGYPLKLVMLGDGQQFERAQSMVSESAVLKGRVFFPGRFPYEQLFAYQSIADIIVCPDRDSIYSNLLVHIKYFDALASGKIVINGAFACMKSINPDQCLSLSFEPSNVDSLANTVAFAADSLQELQEKYKNNRAYCEQHLTYKSTTEDLITFIQKQS